MGIYESRNLKNAPPKIDGDHNFIQAQFNETHQYRSKKEKKR